MCKQRSSSFFQTARARIPVLAAVAVAGAGFAGLCHLAARRTSVSGLVRDADGPVAGATVRVGGRHQVVRTDDAGRFVVRDLEPGATLRVSAWADRHFITRAGTTSPGAEPLDIELSPLAKRDDPTYEWVSAYTESGQPESCEKCHTRPDDPSSTLPFDEWKRDPHSGSAQNPRFLSLYLGTDLEGRKSPPTRFARSRDYGRFPLPPDASKPYYGPGYRLDWPQTAGSCATCHAPMGSVDSAYETDPSRLLGVEAEGVGCDLCHKVAAVDLDPETKLPLPNRPAALSYQFHRPEAGHQFFASPYDNPRSGGHYVPALAKSAFCAPCHHGVFWDTVVYDSYGEWLRSPYADPKTGTTCQGCHMRPKGATRFALPEVGGREHDPQTIHSHDMSIGSLLRKAVTLRVSATRQDGAVEVEVQVTNDQTGHHVPSGSPLRHMILLVEGTDSDGRRLERTGGPVLPGWCGEGDREVGAYGGLPGRVFAKVLEDVWLGQAPTSKFWNPTRLVEDGRLAAHQTDRSRYTFAARPGGAATIRVRLLYRRALFQLMQEKKWDTQDLVMAERTIQLR